MFKWKRSLLLGSLGLSLLAGLMFTSLTLGSTTALANCNSTATNSWGNNCTVYHGNISNFVVAIQTAINQSGKKDPDGGHLCTTGGIDGNNGPNTQSGIECFQDAEHIGDDTIVGMITWGKLGGLLKNDCSTSGGFAYYSIGNAPRCDFAKNTSSGVWWVWFPTDNRFVVMTINSLG
jgi:hypothetical protein